jgi:hypothetical protein
MNVVAATLGYERWLAQRLSVIVERDLKLKDRQMSVDSFSFVRASCYRWAQVWPQLSSVPTGSDS